MNKRQVKKRRKYESMRKAVKMRFNVLPKSWSEIRWTIEWLKHKYRNGENNE